MSARPKWYLPVSILALLWNLMGCAAYLSDVMLSTEDIAAMDKALKSSGLNVEDEYHLHFALGKAMEKQARHIPCFIQVNIGAEEQKGGCAVSELPALIAAAKDSGVPLAGLMCIPPASIEAAPFFALLAELAARHDLPQLSMGMSEDFDTAIMMGATYVRVGTALFGARSSPV